MIDDSSAAAYCRGLEPAGEHRRAVGLEYPGALVQRAHRLLPAPHPGPVEPPVLDVHRVSGPQRGDQVGHLALGPAGPAPARRCRPRWAAASPSRSGLSSPGSSPPQPTAPGRPGPRHGGCRAAARRAAAGRAGRWTTATRARQAQPVVRVRDGALPDGLERLRAHADDRRVVAQLVLDDAPVTVEVMEPDQPGVEQPEVVARQAQARRAAPGQPADLLARGDVQPRRGRVLEPDVIADRLGDDPRPAEPDAPRRVLAHQVVPGRARRDGPRLAGEPSPVLGVSGVVGVPHLQVNRRAGCRRDQLAKRRYRAH